MSDPRNRRSGLTEEGLGVGILHTARTRQAAQLPNYGKKKTLCLTLTRAEMVALDRRLYIYRRGKGGVNASRQDLIRYWIAGGRLY